MPPWARAGTSGLYFELATGGGICRLHNFDIPLPAGETRLHDSGRVDMPLLGAMPSTYRIYLPFPIVRARL